MNWKAMVCVAFMAMMAVTVLIPTGVQATGGITYAEIDETVDSGGYTWTCTDYTTTSGIPSDTRDFGVQFRDLYVDKINLPEVTEYYYVFEQWVGDRPTVLEGYSTADMWITFMCDINIISDVGGEPTLTDTIPMLGALYNASTLRAHSYDDLGQARGIEVTHNSDGSYSLVYSTTVVDAMVSDNNLIGSEFEIIFRVMENPESKGDPMIYSVTSRAKLSSPTVSEVDFHYTIWRGYVDDVVTQKIQTAGDYTFAEYCFNGNEYYTVVPSGYLYMEPHDYTEANFFNADLRINSYGYSDTWLTYPTLFVVPTGTFSVINDPSWSGSAYSANKRAQLFSYLQDPTIDVDLDGDYATSGLIDRGDSFGFNITMSHPNDNWLLDAKATLRYVMDADRHAVDENGDGQPDIVFEGDTAIEHYFDLNDVAGTSTTVGATFTLPASLEDGFYVVMAEGFDKAGNYVAEVSGSIAIGDVAPNTPPTSTIQVTSDIAYNEPVEFVLTIVDEGSSVKYRVYWGDGLWEQDKDQATEWIVCDDFISVPGTNLHQFHIELNHTYTGYDYFEVKVYSQDNLGSNGIVATTYVNTVENEETRLAMLADEPLNVLWGFLVVFGLFLLIWRVNDSWDDLKDEREEFRIEKEQLRAQGIWDTEMQTRLTWNMIKTILKPTNLGWFIVVIAIGFVLVIFNSLTQGSGVWDNFLAVFLDNTILYMKVFAYWLSQSLWGTFNYNSLMMLIGTIFFGFMIGNVMFSFKGGTVRRRF